MNTKSPKFFSLGQVHTFFFISKWYLFCLYVYIYAHVCKHSTCVCTYMRVSAHMRVCAHMCVCVQMHVEVRGQCQVFFSTLFWALELTSMARLAGQQVPYLSPLQHWGCRHLQTCPAFYVGARVPDSGLCAFAAMSLPFNPSKVMLRTTPVNFSEHSFEW